ncbi:MAG: hypothetical protein JWQ38_3602 [Flavipsychrobacter sp.]|nr:hypothetical protein [Flavipsychrobacter sp.]
MKLYYNYMVNNNLKSIISLSCKGVLFSVLFALCGTYAGAQVKKDKKPVTDTFKIANNFIAKKKFRKANKVLKKYHAAHPKDLNSLWLQAQAHLYAGNNKKSNELYQAALKLAPQNDYLKLSYIHSLADMGKTVQAENVLYAMENAGADYSDIALLHARLYYYEGNNKKANVYMKKALQYDNKNGEANDLDDMIQAAKAPHVSLSSSYLSDNQPLTILTSSIKADLPFNKSLNIFVEGTDYHFLQNTTSDAPWVRIGNRMFFPKAGMHLTYGGGIMKFPVKNEVSWTGELSLNQKISQQFDVDLSLDHGPYFGTKSSVDTNISAYRFAAMLNWHKNNWLAQAAFLNSLYPDNNNVYGAYAYLLAPVVVFQQGKLQLGLSSSYSNSNSNRYQSVQTLGDILSTFTPNMTIGGVYDPYFTPGDLYINSALLLFSVNASKEVSININGDVGTGSILNPYLYLDKTPSGAIYIAKGYSTEHFTPYSASFALSYHIDKTWNLSGKYTYRSTYFFNSNYASISLDKSFQHRKKDTKTVKKSAFSRSIQDIEDKIQALYRCKNVKDLKQSTDNIRTQLVALRDAQLKKKNSSEITPGSMDALRMQDRYNSLNEMIAEIDSVDFDDKEAKDNKREWLTDKQFELTSIHYNGSFDEE